MNTNIKQQRLIDSFYTAIGWNAFSYAFYKTSYMLLSCALYTRLSKSDFALWAALMSFIFLGLLFLDCGFRKSVPRYCPEFLTSPALYNTFIRCVAGIQVGILLLALPVCYYWGLPYFQKIVTHHNSHFIFIIATILFLLQGCVGLLRIIYYAHFWNKQFTTITTIIGFLEFLLGMGCCFAVKSNNFLLPDILILHCLSSASIVLVTYYKMPSINFYSMTSTTIMVSESLMKRQFIVHSCFMWLANILKSLTERNFLLPYIIYTLGPTVGILFKLANDAALFFYRLALKTLSTNDTGFLSYARQDRGGIKKAFNTLKKTVLLLVLILISIALVGLVYVCYTTSLASQTFIIIFCVCFIGYMIEIVLSPYERILEVSLDYKALIQAYIPYCIVLTLVLHYQLIAVAGLVPFIVVIQALRSVSSCIVAYKVKEQEII